MPNLCFCQVSLFPFWRRIFWSSGNELQTLFPFYTLVASKQSAYIIEIHRGLMSEDCKFGLHCLYGHQTKRLDLETSRRLRFPTIGLGMATS